MRPYQIGSTDWIKQELAGLLGQQVTRDIDEIIRLYSLYDGDGQRWQVNTNGLDYTPTVKVTNIIAELIGKEARYMMGVEPELRIVPKRKGQSGGAGERRCHRQLADRAAGRAEVEQEAAGRGEGLLHWQARCVEADGQARRQAGDSVSPQP